MEVKKLSFISQKLGKISFKYLLNRFKVLHNHKSICENHAHLDLTKKTIILVLSPLSRQLNHYKKVLSLVNQIRELLLYTWKSSKPAIFMGT